VVSDTLLVKDLFDKFLETRTDLKLRTKRHYKMTRNILESFQPGLKVADITVDSLKMFEKYKLDNSRKKTTVDTLNRNIRSLLRYYKYKEPLIPESFKIPFGNGKISISSYFPNKVVLYRCNGRNMADATDALGRYQG
jgi:hypothetical protein